MVLQGSGSQSIGPGAAAAASLGSSLEVNLLRSHPHLQDWQLWEWNRWSAFSQALQGMLVQAKHEHGAEWSHKKEQSYLWTKL